MRKIHSQFKALSPTVWMKFKKATRAILIYFPIFKAKKSLLKIWLSKNQQLQTLRGKEFLISYFPTQLSSTKQIELRLWSKTFSKFKTKQSSSSCQIIINLTKFNQMVGRVFLRTIHFDLRNRILKEFLSTMLHRVVIFLSEQKTSSLQSSSLERTTARKKTS